MMSIENQASKIFNYYLKITKEFYLAKQCALFAIELIMINCKKNKIHYWLLVEKEIYQYQSILKDLRKYNKDNMPI